MRNFSFCESVYAGPCGVWHIRELTSVGAKTGGGIDTKSLCGHVRPDVGGWDLEVPITEQHLQHACGGCAEAYRKLVEAK